MPTILTFFPRRITAKGIKRTPPSTEKIKQFLFDDDEENIRKIIPLNHSFRTTPTLFYPGCGCDILTPLLFIEKLLPQLSEIKFHFVDEKDNFDLIKTILDDVNIPFSEENNFIYFYWNTLLVSLQFVRENVFTTNLPEFHIYFERSFRIMKDRDQTYEQRIYQQLSANGLLISDSGFQNLPLKIVPIPTGLSAYQEMIMGIKN